MTQYLGIILQFRLLLATSHVYVYASVPSCTSIIKLSTLSILIKHTLKYQHNLSTITLHVKLSQGSDLLLRRDTNLLQQNNDHAAVTTNLAAVKYLNNLDCPTRANSLQRKPHSLHRVLSVFAEQGIKFKTQLTIHNSSFLAATRTPLAAASTLYIKGSLT